jgi:elongation factor Ts
MTKVDAQMVSKLRKESGAPMMDCKRALQEAQCDWEKANDILRKKGLKSADSKVGREASEGRVFSYIHSDNKTGVLLEIDCETDFVARNEDFVAFGHDLCLHLAFTKPPYLVREDVPAAAVEKERNYQMEKVAEQMGDKPAEIQEKALEGRMDKFFEDQCFLEQGFIKEDKLTIEECLKQQIGKIGENLIIKRFQIFVVGV